MEIRDFLRMHYDCPRRDTAFWQDLASTPLPEKYRALKETLPLRVPRLLDLEGYITQGRRGMFHIINWLFVAHGLGLIPPHAAKVELMSLSEEERQKVSEFLGWLEVKKAANA